MEMESYQHGVPSWIDHSSPDPAGAGAFYGALFGWDIREGGPESGGYSLATKSGRNVAGIPFGALFSVISPTGVPEQ